MKKSAHPICEVFSHDRRRWLRMSLPVWCCEGACFDSQCWFLHIQGLIASLQSTTHVAVSNAAFERRHAWRDANELASVVST